MRTLAALTFAVALAWCGSADAKDLWHVGGDIVDSRGVLVGEVIGFAGLTEWWAGGPRGEALPPLSGFGFPGGPTLMLRAGGVTVPLFVHGRHLEGMTYLWFATPDCTGDAYVLPFGGGSSPLWNESAMFGARVYVYDRIQNEPVTVQSVASGGGGCITGIVVQEMDLTPARLLIDLTGRWTPPFRIR